MSVAHARTTAVTSIDEHALGDVPGLLEVLARVQDPRRFRGCATPHVPKTPAPATPETVRRSWPRSGNLAISLLYLAEQGRVLLARAQGMRGVEYARTAHLLGELLAIQGDDDAALTALETALDIRRTALGLNHPDTAVTLRALADVLRRKDRQTDACEALQAALPIFERNTGPDHPWTIQLRAELKPSSADSTVS